MATIFSVAGFEVQPVDKDVYIKTLREFLRSGIPATVTTKDIELAAELEAKINAGEEIEPVDGGDTGTTPLHRICESLSETPSALDLETAEAMIDTLFEYGANWMLLDDNNETAGCIALRRKLPSSIYNKFVAAGVRSEILLHKLAENTQLESDDEDHNQHEGDTAADQKAYLQSELEYTDTSLITRRNKDGVMMSWEEPIMRKSAQLLTSTSDQSVVLNVGFGMGIIDGLIQQQNPKRHYISEAHPAVLAKMRQDGWYDKPNVTVLEGRWQDTVPKLIAQGEFLDGIYYDTFSEHYTDLIDFCDNVVGLLQPTGIFSYFNGLGADRQICYDVYCQVVQLEMGEYGLEVAFETMSISDDSGEDIRHKYWALDTYQLPVIKFVE